MKELALWQNLRHPNIVQFLGVLNNSNRLIFLTEYLCNVSFFFFFFLFNVFFFLKLIYANLSISSCREVCMIYLERKEGLILKLQLLMLLILPG